MAEFKLDFSQTFKTTTCITCGVSIVMPEGLYRERLRGHANFFCPNGHSQVFVDEHLEVKLKRELEQERKRREWAERDAKIMTAALDREKAASARLRKRVKNGVCPCCHRTFKQLARHMVTKHPGYPERYAPRPA